MGKIVGLDPTQLSYSYNEVGVRLAATDASYVEVMHTSGLIGFEAAIGTADFYVNGGRYQPGCREFFGECSHQKAFDYYIESIKGSEFYALQCSSYEQFKAGNCGDKIGKMGGEPGQIKYDQLSHFENYLNSQYNLCVFKFSVPKVFIICKPMHVQHIQEEKKG